MAETAEERVARLLEEGLERYGDGDISAAMVAWEAVLALDPGNAEAQDYIRTADRRSVPRPRKPGAGRAVAEPLEKEARELLAAGHPEAALELLRSASDAMPQAVALQGLLDLLRVDLLRLHRRAVGDLSATPRTRGDPSDLTRFNLPADAGFLLSMVDGQTPIADLVSLSGMDEFEALRLLVGLREAGIVEIAP